MVDFECGESIWTEINRESKIKKFTSLGSPRIPSQWEQFQSNCLDFLILPTPSIPRFKQQHLLDEKLLAQKKISQADQVKGKEPLINCSFFSPLILFQNSRNNIYWMKNWMKNTDIY